MTDVHGDLNEPILNESNKRYTIYPIQDQELWSLYKKHESVFWRKEDINYTADKTSWDLLSPDEQYFIEHILAFFACADSIVLENLSINFGSEVKLAEARAFYAIQMHIEQIHAETYSQLIETYITDPAKKNKLFNSFTEVPCVTKKADWALKWMSTDRPFRERIIAFIIVEGIFFSGAFCAIFWLKSRGLMTKTLGLSNEYISRDEGLHAEFGTLIYKRLVKKVPENVVYQIFEEAVEIESEFITASIPCSLLGMNSELMIEYIKYIADYWLTELGYKKLYNVDCPFDFMLLNKIDGKSNFFEQQPTEYNKSSLVMGAQSYTFNEDF